jgi:3-isopropylmalate dehydrogenase
MRVYKTIALLPGDGVGPEVIKETVKVLNVVADRAGIRLEYDECLVGGASIDMYGEPITARTLEICKNSDSVLLGAVGGDKWDNLPLKIRPERALLEIRKALGCFANLRPITLFSCLVDTTPVKSSLVQKGIDMVILRELNYGLYYGDRGRRNLANGEVEAYDTGTYTASAIRQIAQLGFEIARSRRRNIVSMDKSNILETSRLWREVVTQVSEMYPDITLKHQLIDSGAMLLITRPADFDVILVNNEFGDIISDEASVLAGAIGMVPSAALGLKPPFFFEPIHGSAPDIAGKNLANPIASILTGALLFQYGFGMNTEAAMIRTAVAEVLEAGYRTWDIAGSAIDYVSTSRMGDLIAEAVIHPQMKG